MGLYDWHISSYKQGMVLSRLKAIFILALGLVVSLSGRAADLTSVFQKTYADNSLLSFAEQAQLRQFDFYLVPGILSEAFLKEDDRSSVSFARLTGDYLGTQQELLQNVYKFNSVRLSSSSKSVSEIKDSIRAALNQSASVGRKAVFLTHSLGGLALLEELVDSPNYRDSVAGIVFLQSPFKGSPIADAYFDNPIYLDKFLGGLIPFFNTSPETIRYLGTASRSQFMKENSQTITTITNIPMITVGGVVNGQNSLFTPAVNIMAMGCLEKVFGQCVVRLYSGPYDLSDGMVPFESSKLPGVDFVRLDGADHGETVVNIPYEQYDKARTTTALLRLLLPSLKTR
ncbi:hypothetical protein ACNQKP_13760 [Bdellovibrio bacteriovorus]|uniref:hypothetical protein n=1 Tax=Bdellovibrio bacteriovorus TaxID=959 RepID=UPI003AA9D204